MTFIRKFGLCVIVSAFFFGCSDKGTSHDKETSKEIEVSCEESGGLFLDAKNRCLCGEILCAEGVLCDESDTTVCSGMSIEKPADKTDDGKIDEKVDEKPADKDDDGKTEEKVDEKPADKDDDGKTDEKVDEGEVDPVDESCQKSGGLFVDAKKRCLCGETLCAEGVLCDESDKTVCSGTSTEKPADKDDGGKTDEKADEEKPGDKADEKADEKEVDPAKEPCEKSGGVYDEESKVCQCGEYKCGIGVACSSSDKGMCADFDCTPEAMTCLNGTFQTCSDKGRWSTSQVCPGNASCASETECGECKDGDIKCDDDPETNVGTSKICVKGKWEVQNECANEEGRPVSCLKEASGPSKVCGECRNMPTQQCTNVTTPGASTDLLIGHLYMCEGGKMRGFQKSAEGEITLTEDKYIKCDAGNSCNPDRTACGECCVGRGLCRNDGIAWKDGHPDGTVGQMYTCVDGVIDANPTPCPNETLCDDHTLGQRCGECGMTSKWHHGYNCFTSADGKQYSQVCAASRGGGNWDYYGYWKIWDTCHSGCITSESYGSQCYGKCLQSNGTCGL